jgi:hypothetical protein
MSAKWLILLFADGIKELVDRDEERVTKRQAEKRDALDKEREGRLKRHASLAEGREIVPNLYLGGRLAAQNWEWLDQCKIKCVLNVTGDVSNYYEGEEGFSYHRYAVEDISGSRIGVFFDETTDLIRKELEAGHAVLVHCREGLSRSPTIVTSFLMQETNMKVEDALKLVEEKNGIVRINKGFLAELNELHKQLFNEESSLFDPRERAEKVSYDDMTTAEKKAYDAQMARKNRVRKRPLTLSQFIELKSQQIRERKEAAAAVAAVNSPPAVPNE